MTTDQVLAAAATITALSVVLAVVVIVRAIRIDREGRRSAEAYMAGWSEGTIDALRAHGPSTDHPTERLRWIMDIKPREDNPYGEVEP